MPSTETSNEKSPQDQPLDKEQLKNLLVSFLGRLADSPPPAPTQESKKD